MGTEKTVKPYKEGPGAMGPPATIFSNSLFVTPNILHPPSFIFHLPFTWPLFSTQAYSLTIGPTVFHSLHQELPTLDSLLTTFSFISFNFYYRFLHRGFEETLYWPEDRLGSSRLTALFNRTTLTASTLSYLAESS